jgi:sugar fermentation stimulation protein A
MKLGERMVDGIFLERPNRYLAQVEIEGRQVFAHVPDPGRLPGLMIPQRRVRLIHNPSAKRKTDYTMALVKHGRIWVSVFPVFANRLVGDALANRVLPGFSGYTDFSSEVKVGHSRFDFQLDFAAGPMLVEVKSVSLVEQTVGKFPDAPTERGRRHVEELIELKRKGKRTAVVFVSQRSDTQTITSNDVIDPEFGKRLREAKREGVELYGFNCKVTASAVTLDQPVEVIMQD